MTYTLTFDLTNAIYSVNIVYYNYETCRTDDSFTGSYNITEIGDNFSAYLISVFGGTCTYVIDGNIITFTWTFENAFDPTCGELLTISLRDEERNEFTSLLTTSGGENEVCPTCQEVSFVNCISVLNFTFTGITEGFYNFVIEDHQTGVKYTQTVEIASNEATWNTSEMPGVLTPFSVYTLTITDGGGQPVSWTSGDKEYTCARITFTNTVNTNVVT